MKITEAIDSVAFKHALFEGKVEFDYVKNDGTLRHAVGTMNEALIPKVEPIVAKYHVTDIKWAPRYNGELVTKKLPKKCKICVTQPEIDEFGADAMDDVIIKALEKKYSAYVTEFEYYEIDVPYDEEPRKLPEGSVFYYDIDKQAYRSFKIAQLKGWKSC